MEFYAKIINGFRPFTIFAKSSVLDVWEGFEYSHSRNVFKDTVNYHNGQYYVLQYIWNCVLAPKINIINMQVDVITIYNFVLVC